MLVVNEADRIELTNVEPKNKAAASKSQRDGWDESQSRIAIGAVDGSILVARLFMENERDAPWNVRLLIVHSKDQSMRINPANVRRRATLGTST